MAIGRKMKVAIGGAVAAGVVLVPVTRYLRSGDEALYTVTSPDRRSKLEFRSASKWQVVTHETADQLGYVRLHLPSGKVVASHLFELSGSGPTLWTDNGGVQVGTSAIYEPKAERWSLQ